MLARNDKKLIMAMGVVLFLALIIFLFLFFGFQNTSQDKKITTSLSGFTVVLDKENIQNNPKISHIKDTTIEIKEYTVDSPKLPLSFTTSEGNYKYNISFSQDKVSIEFAADTKLSANLDSTKIVISTITIAAWQQKEEDQLINGSLFDKQIRDDHLRTLDQITNDNSLNQLTIINLNK